MKLPTSLTTVTPLSKSIAAALFVTLPMAFFFLGYSLVPTAPILVNNVNSHSISITPTPEKSTVSPNTSISPTSMPLKTSIQEMIQNANINQIVDIDGNKISVVEGQKGAAAGTTYHHYIFTITNNSQSDLYINPFDFKLKELTEQKTTIFKAFYSMEMDVPNCNYSPAIQSDPTNKPLDNCFIKSGATNKLTLVYPASDVPPYTQTPQAIYYTPTLAIDDEIIFNVAQ